MSKKTKAIALSAIMASLAIIIMLLGGIIPIMTYCSPIISSLCLIPIIDKYGKKMGFAAYIVISILSLIFCPDKESAFFWVFFGWYPVIKPVIDEKIKPKPLRLVTKLTIFCGATFLMYFITCNVLGIVEITESFSSGGYINFLFYLLMIIVLFLYDNMLAKLKIVYINKYKHYFDQ